MILGSAAAGSVALPESFTLKAFAESISVEVATGTCGNNLKYTVTAEEDSESHERANFALTIEKADPNSSAGAMENFVITGGTPNTPWAEWMYDISTVVVKDATTVGNFAFYSFSNLKSAEFLSAITVGDYAFMNCVNMESVKFTGALQRIGKYAFESCFSLKLTNLPDGVEIDDYAFHQCTSLDYFKALGGVERIGERAFFECDGLKSVYVSGSINKIDKYAFYGDKSLEEITVYGSIETIDDYAFYYCQNLKTIKVPGGTEEDKNGIGTIGSHAFYADFNLNYLEVTGSVGEIKDYAFYQCFKYGGRVLISGGVEKPIGDFAFYDNYDGINGTGLQEVRIPGGVKEIGDYAFYNDRKLVNFEIPGGLETIGEYAFYNCEELGKFDLGGTVTKVGDFAFYKSGLTSISIPKETTDIGKGAFSYCTKLPAISVSASNPNYSASNGVMYNKDKTEILCYPAGKTDATFVIPETVTSIGEWAFAGCSAPATMYVPMIKVDEETIITPLGEVKDHAFEDVTDLKDIYYYGTESNKANIGRGANDEPFFDEAEWHFGHEHYILNATETIEPSCTDKGSEKGTCICGYPVSNPISELGHDMTRVEAVEATCAREGNDEYYTCSRCNKLFKDSEGETATTLFEVTIPKTDHSYDESYEWTADYRKCTLKLTCSVCGATASPEMNVTAETKEASCETAGGTVYTATLQYKGKTYKDIKDVTVPGAGHKLGEPIEKKDATCTEEGYTKSVCSVCGQTITEKIDKIPHDYVEKIIVEPTTSSEGTARYTCSVCGDSYEEKIPALFGVSITGASALKDGKLHVPYKTKVTYHAGASNIPVASITWYDGSKVLGRGYNLTVNWGRQDYNVKAVVTDTNGNVYESEEIEVSVSHTFLDVIVWFFGHLINPYKYVVELTEKGELVPVKQIWE